MLTAPSHQLHLMLIDAAIRHAKESEAALRRGDPLAADGPSMRLIDILSELLVGVRQKDTELNQKIADLYLYLFRLAGEAKVNDDPDKLVEALRLLEYERATWQLVCDKLGRDAAPAAPLRAPLAAPFAAPAAPSAGLSWQA